MRQMKASEFKATCLRVMDEVAKTGDEVIITKNNQPVVRIVPLHQTGQSLFGLHAGKIRSTDDVISPLETIWGDDL